MELSQKKKAGQIKNLIDKAEQLIKVTDITFDIDLEIVKNEITDDIIYTIENYDTKIDDKAKAMKVP